MQFDGKSERIAAELRQRIDRGDIQPGDLLPTTVELAAEYGVAKSTVTRSLALLTQEKRIATRRGCGCRVLEPTAARQAGGQNQEIGFYLPRIAFDYNQRSPGMDVWSEIISGAAAVAARSGYRLTFIPALGGSPCDDLRRSGCRNVLIHGGDPDFFEEFITGLLPRQLRYVLINRTADFRRVQAVDEFGYASGLALCRELAAQGFRRLAVLGTCREAFDYSRIFPAHAQYLAETGQTQLPLVYRLPERTPDAEYDAAVRLLWHDAERPDALVIFRGRFFDGTMRALARAGIRVPEDLPVLLVESLSEGEVWQWHGLAVAGYALPSKREFGALAARMLLEQIRNPAAQPAQRELPLTPVFGATACLSPEAKHIEIDPISSIPRT